MQPETQEQAGAQHTPGPWSLVGEEGDGKFALLGNERPYGSMVTSAGPVTITDEVAFIETDSFANAKLIASAPDLLAEVQRLRQQVAELLSAHHSILATGADSMRARALRKCHDIARAAIARAQASAKEVA